MAVILKLDGVSKSFARVETNDITTALTEVNLEMKSGEFISLVGTSGCGKSTMLRLIAGLIQPTTGKLSVNIEEITQAQIDEGLFTTMKDADKVMEKVWWPQDPDHNFN